MPKFTVKFYPSNSDEDSTPLSKPTVISKFTFTGSHTALNDKIIEHEILLCKEHPHIAEFEYVVSWTAKRQSSGWFINAQCK